MPDFPQSSPNIEQDFLICQKAWSSAFTFLYIYSLQSIEVVFYVLMFR